MLVRIVVRVVKIYHTNIYKKRREVLDAANAQANDIITIAHKTAQETILSAHKKAEATLHSTEVFMQELNKRHEKLLLHNTNMHITALEGEIESLKEKLSTSVEQSSKMFDNNLSEAHNDFDGKTKEMLGRLDQHLSEEIESLHSAVLQKLEDTQNIFQAQSEKAYASMQNELDTYKKERIDSINSSINDVLLAVSRKVLGHSLSLEEHQAYIMKSLEEAKHLLDS